MLAGLWLAPLAVTANSSVYKEHKDWLIRDKKESLMLQVRTGVRFMHWISIIRALLIISGISLMLSLMNGDMIWLSWISFMLPVCLIHNKTRGEVMCDAMDLIRDCVGDKNYSRLWRSAYACFW